MIPSASMEMNGWTWNEEAELVVPVWFKGKQLPPSLYLNRKERKFRALQRDPQEADSEMSEVGDTKRKKIPRRKRKLEGSKIVLPKHIYAEEEMYDGGEEGDTESIGAGSEQQDVSDVNNEESAWEVFDFSSSEDSFDERQP